MTAGTSGTDLHHLERLGRDLAMDAGGRGCAALVIVVEFDPDGHLPATIVTHLPERRHAQVLFAQALRRLALQLEHGPQPPPAGPWP